MISDLKVAPISHSPPGAVRPASVTVLVVDDSALCREVTTMALRAQGYMTVEAEDGRTALSILERRRVDLIILDHDMPQMSGITLLRKLRANPRTASLPVLMLTAATGREIVVEAMKLGIKGYLLKTRSSVPEILMRVRAVIDGVEIPATPHAALPPRNARPEKQKPVAEPSKVIAPKLMSRETTISGIAEFTGAKTLAGVVADVIELSNSNEVGLSDLSKILKQDPVLAARVLQMASSAAYAGGKSKVASVDDAVRSIGASATRDIALTVGIFASFPPGPADGLDLLRCWLHAFAVAMVMNRIVPRSDKIPAGTAHLIGLCHDLPEMILRQRFPNEFAALLDFSKQTGTLPANFYESSFGLSRTELTETVFDNMKFPASISDPIIEYSRNDRASAEAQTSLLTKTLAIANHFAHGLMLATSLDELVAPVQQADCQSSLIPTGQIDWQKISADAIATTAMLSKLKGPEKKSLETPLYPRDAARVGYLRHQSFAALDPLEAALDGLCRLTRLEKPSISDDDQMLNGIVVVSPVGDASLAAEICRLREQAGKAVPILHVLSARGGGFIGPDHAYEEVEYPITMKRLAQFIAAVQPKG